MKAFGFRPKLYTALKNYSKELFMADLMAGIIVGIVALPLAIAFGIASGVSPEKGIITAIIAGFIISLMGGSKVQIGGPTGAFIVIIYGIIQQYGESGLIVATLMAGVLLILLGVFKLGAVIKFIPYPIIVGFTSGIAVTIFTTQIADIFGLTFGGEKVPGDFVGKWMIYFRHFDTVNWWNTIVSIVSIFIIAITPRFSKKIPGSLIAIIVVTVAVWLMKVYGGIDCIDTIGDRFSIRAELPDARFDPRHQRADLRRRNALCPQPYKRADFQNFGDEGRLADRRRLHDGESVLPEHQLSGLGDRQSIHLSGVADADACLRFGAGNQRDAGKRHQGCAGGLDRRRHSRNCG